MKLNQKRGKPPKSVGGSVENADEQKKGTPELFAAAQKFSDLSIGFDGVMYATLDEDQRTVRVDSHNYSNFLRRLGRETLAMFPSRDVVSTVVAHLLSTPESKLPRVHVGVRSVELDGQVLIDPCWIGPEVIRVSAKGWAVGMLERASSARFARSNEMLRLHAPVKGGTLALFKRYFPIGDGELLLLIAFLAFQFRDGVPYPLPFVSGQQGSGKSSFASACKRLVDCNRIERRAMWKNPDDLGVAARNNRLLIFDNVSGLKLEHSDLLCKMATGGYISRRSLYSDAGETSFQIHRASILNGIPDMVQHSDLADRGLFFQLEAIPPSARRDEKAYWQDFDQDAGKLLGVVLDVLSRGLARESTVTLTVLPRMADFARFGAAAFGDAFTAAYAKNQSLGQQICADAEPLLAILARVIFEKMGRSLTWDVVPETLRQAVAAECERTAQDRALLRLVPNNTQGMGTLMKRSSAGLSVRFGINWRVQRGSERVYQFARVQIGESTDSTFSTVAANQIVDAVDLVDLWDDPKRQVRNLVSTASDGNPLGAAFRFRTWDLSRDQLR